MKKIIIMMIIAIVVILTAVGYFIYKEAFSDKISEEEKEFNESGRAKAIESETDLWKIYEDKNADFSIKYSGDVLFGDIKTDELHLTVSSEKVDTLEGTMGFNKETALKNMESLGKGEYGENVDWPINESKKVRKISDINAQEFMVLSRFEVCSVVFERKLYFFSNNYQVVITLAGPRDEIINNAPEYFTTNKENCGDEKIWNFDKQGQFFENLEKNAGPEAAQEWFNLFDKIAGTIIINSENQSKLDLLQGKWESTDDSEYVVEFKDEEKIDYYSGKKSSEGSFNLYDGIPATNDNKMNNDGEYLVVNSDDQVFEYRIVEVSDQNLVLTYLLRGNTLKFKKI